MSKHPKYLLPGLAVTLASLLISWSLSDRFNELERGATAAKYRIRGESRVDSSIVILYLSGDDITSLGGLPIKRSYYALIINVLHELGARVVGVDLAFSEHDREHPEYDDLLARVMKESGNVVLSGYFHNFPEHPAEGEHSGDSLVGRFTIPVSSPEKSTIRGGRQLELPIPDLLNAAAGFGHTNLTDQFDVPLLIGDGSGRFVPSFGYAVYMAGLARQRTADPINHGADPLSGDPSGIPGAPNADVTINYAGGAHSLNTIPIVSFLQAYDLWNAEKAGGAGLPSILNVKNKIVLIGVISEGRSAFIPMPFAQQFPAIGINAMFIDNAIHRSFIRQMSMPAQYSLALLIGVLCTILLLSDRELIAGAIIAGVLILYMVASYLLFSTGSYILPITRQLFTAFAVTGALLVYKQQKAKSQLLSLSREREEVNNILREKEAALTALEAELASVQNRMGEERALSLSEEIRRYQDEIARLKVQTEDFQPFSPSGPAGYPEGTKQIFGGIVYNSAGPIAEVVSFIEKIAPSDAAVLVLGESGTGKELVARAVHDHSGRRNKPFIAVNCGALTETLLETELFGHERGAFTGAVRDRQGRFEIADEGTIFLDEIAETSESFQVKLLRVLQDGSFERVGGTETKRVNVRVIAATNRNLRQTVEERGFREDLFYRLNVFTIQLPPLRERTMDIPFLVDQFIAREDPAMKTSAVVMNLLREQPWKGNVRELQSVIIRAVLLAKAEGLDMVRIRNLPPEIAASAQSVTDIEDRVIESLRSKKFSHNAISETAGELGGLNRGTVAEYFRGFCFKIFSETRWDVSASVERIAHNSDPDVREKVRKKLSGYLTHAVEAVDLSQPLDVAKASSKPKFKNLPQRYHAALEEIIAAYHGESWKLD